MSCQAPLVASQLDQQLVSDAHGVASHGVHLHHTITYLVCKLGGGWMDSPHLRDRSARTRLLSWCEEQ